MNRPLISASTTVWKSRFTFQEKCSNNVSTKTSKGIYLWNAFSVKLYKNKSLSVIPSSLSKRNRTDRTEANQKKCRLCLPQSNTNTQNTQTHTLSLKTKNNDICMFPCNSIQQNTVSLPFHMEYDPEFGKALLFVFW